MEKTYRAAAIFLRSIDETTPRRPHSRVGILSFVVCPFFGIAAWVMGNTDLEEMAWGRMDPTGKDLTNAGRICGMIATGLLVLQVIVLVVVFTVMATLRH